MKKFILFILIVLLYTPQLFAQLKLGYVDSEAIMSQLPDAQDAQKKIDALIQEWQEQIKKMETEWKKSYKEYENRKLIMSNQKRAETEKKLMKMENDIAEFKKKKFGANGELFQKQEELMKPVQNKVFNAIKEVAEANDLDFVFDKSGDLMFLYAKEEYDITPLVLEVLQ